MTFEMVRMGWPNTAAIVALALMPVVSLTTMAQPNVHAVQVEQRDAATLCPSDGAMILATLIPGSVLE